MRSFMFPADMKVSFITVVDIEYILLQRSDSQAANKFSFDNNDMSIYGDQCCQRARSKKVGIILFLTFYIPKLKHLDY